MADRPNQFSPLAVTGSSAAVKAEVTDSVSVQFVLNSKGKTSADVVVLGSWDDWSRATKLDKKEDTLETSLDLPCGPYEYKYKMDKTWFCDTTKPVVPNVFGTLNNYIQVVKATEGASATTDQGTNVVTQLDVETLQQALAKVSSEKESSEDRVEEVGQGDVRKENVEISGVEGQTMDEDTGSTRAVARQEFIIQDSLMSICMTPEMPQFTSKQTPHGDKGPEKTDSRQRRRDEPVTCICRTPEIPPIRPTLQETTSEDLSGLADVATVDSEATSQVQTAAEVDEDVNEQPKEKDSSKSSAEQELVTEDVLEEKESVVESKVESGEQPVARKPEETEAKSEEKERIAHDTAEKSDGGSSTETQIQAIAVSTLETSNQKVEETVLEISEEKVSIEVPPQIEVEGKAVPETLERTESPTQVPSLKDTLNKAVADLHAKTDVKPPSEPTNLSETVASGAEKESKETTAQDNNGMVEDKAVTEADTEDRPAIEVSEEKYVTSDERVEEEVTPQIREKTQDETDLKSAPTPETAEQPSGDQAAVEESLSAGEKVDKPVPDVVKEAYTEHISTETPAQEKQVKDVARDIDEKKDQKVSDKIAPENEASERPEVDTVRKPEETFDTVVLDNVVESVDEEVLQAAPILNEKSGDDITPDETIQISVQHTVAAPEEKDATEVQPQEKTNEETATDLDNAITTEAPTQDETIEEGTTKEAPSSETPRPGDTTVIDTSEGSPDKNEISPPEEAVEKVAPDTAVTSCDTDQTEAPLVLPTEIQGTDAKEITTDTVVELETSEKNVPGEVEKAKDKTFTEKPTSEEPPATIAMETVKKTYAQVVKESLPPADVAEKNTEDTVVETILTDKIVEVQVEALKEEIPTETPPEETVSCAQRVEITKEEIHTDISSKDNSVQELVIQKVELEKEEIHIEESPEDKTVEKTVSEKVSKEEMPSEKPPTDKTVEELKVEFSKEEEIHTETQPADHTVAEAVSEELLVSKVEIYIEEPAAKETVVETVQQKVSIHTETTAAEDKPAEQTVPEKVEKIDTDEQPTDKTVEEAVQPQKVEIPKEDILIATPLESKTVEERVPQKEKESEEEIQIKATLDEDKTVEEVVPKVEMPKEGIQVETSPDHKTVKEIVPQNVEVSKEEIHTDSTPKVKTAEDAVQPQDAERPKEELHIEVPPEDKKVEEVASQKVEVSKEEIHIETPPEDEAVEEAASQKVEVAKEETHIETPPEDKIMEEAASQKVEVAIEETHIETPPEDEAVEEAASQKVEVSKVEIHIETPTEDKTSEKTSLQKVEVSKEEIHVETLPTDTTTTSEEAVQQKVELLKEEIHIETKQEEKIFEEPMPKQEVQTKEEIHTEIPPKDTTIEKTVPQKLEVSEKDIHTEIPPEDKVVKQTATHKVEPCYKTIHEILTEDTTERIPLFEYTQFRLMYKKEARGDVFVQGSWDGWKESFKLNKGEDAVYTVSVMLPYGLHEYKYRVGNSWIHDEKKPSVRNAFGTINNVLKVPLEGGVKGSIDMTAEEGAELEESKRVRLGWTGEASGDVFVSGSWDGWTRSWKLKKSSENEYGVFLNLPCRQHQYKLRTGNTWFYDKSKPIVSNSFGTFNNTINIAATPEKMAKPWGKRTLTDY